jgi:hypothetical protein
MRVTDGKKNGRTIFYFGSVSVSESSLVGAGLRFIDSTIKIIRLDSMTKIEVQDGHKKFLYVDQ